MVVRGRGRSSTRPANPAVFSEVSTDSSRAPAADTDTSDAASVSGNRPSRAPGASVCQPQRGRRCAGSAFEQLDAQAYLDRWERRWADTPIHGTTKRQVAAMFAEERPALGPLPLQPFRYYQYGHRTVRLDGCVEVTSAYYGAPPGWIGRRVHVQWNDAHVRLLAPHSGQLLREHLRAPRGWHRVEDRDGPARTPPKTLALRATVKRAAPAISTICDHIHRHYGAAGVRRVRGVRALARKHGPAVAEEAATAALELGVPTYRFLRRYLDRRPVALLSRHQVDPLIRQLTLYLPTAISLTAEQETRHETSSNSTRRCASSASPAWPTSSTRACSRLRPSGWPRSTSLPPSSLTNSSGARTASSPDETSRRTSATPNARSAVRSALPATSGWRAGRRTGGARVSRCSG